MKVKRSSRFLAALLVTSVVLIAACTNPAPTPKDARLTGTITVAGTADRAERGAALQQATTSANLRTLLQTWQLDESLTDFVPGELIVRFAEPAAGLAGMSLQVASASLDYVRPVGVGESVLYRLPSGIGAQMAVDPVQATLAAARELNARPDVLYAHPNYIFHTTAVPNDPHYGLQWHYDQIDMEGAWDITTGSSDVVVGVVDSGILYSPTVTANRHPDFAASRILPGYDFVSDPARALDGDGRDADPFDMAVNDGFHGSHVAGTIGAATNNGVGVAGVDWNAKFFAARTMGLGGSGSFVDIIEGMQWAAGYTISGVPVNNNPADVINMSLGAQGVCFPELQAAIDLVTTRAIVVVAAGNDNISASDAAPASCSGIITVGATDYQGRRAPYSNFGSRIDVMAPGGDTNVDLNGDGFSDGVLSLGYDTGAGDWDYFFYQGTSMAAPHVTGVIALMKALKPSLTTEEALGALRATAHKLTDGQCNGQGAPGRTLGANDCGAGLIDARAALQYIDDGSTTPVAGNLLFQPAVLDYGATTTELTFELTNTGSANLSWSIDYFYDAVDNPGPVPGGDSGAIFYLAGYPGSGTLAPGASTTTGFAIDRDALTEYGQYQVLIGIFVDGTEYDGPILRFYKLPETPAVAGPTVVEASIYVNDDWLVSGSQSSPSLLTSFDFRASPGQTVVGAWIDVNSNGVIDGGDYVGFHGNLVQVEAGKQYDVPIVVAPYFEGSPTAWPAEWLDTLGGSRPSGGSPSGE